MPTLNIPRTRTLLEDFDFSMLFIEELHWSRPVTRRPGEWQHEGVAYAYRHIAELAGVVVMEVTGPDEALPAAKVREAVQKGLTGLHRENLLIFVDEKRTQSLWRWVKREDGKTYPREHLYLKGQPGDLFISKISGMVFDISRFDASGNVSIVEVADSLKKALDVERVTKRFYEDFKSVRLEFTELIEGIPNERERRWYASVMLNRLMFIYFLQNKGFVDNVRMTYLQEHLAASAVRFGSDQYYEQFLKPLFFEGFAKPEGERTPQTRQMLGNIVYLNGGLFLKHIIEEKNETIRIPDQAFVNLFTLFGRYSWNLNDTPGGNDNEINPDVLGYIFEKYINQKAFGAYYTRPEITEYLCEHTIHQLILDKMQPGMDILGLPVPRRFESLADLLLNLDAALCRRLLFEVLPGLSLLDPACGSGAFLVAAMKTLINVYSAITGRIDYLNDTFLTNWIRTTRAEHKSLNYFIKRAIITNNLFGADIMEEACEIAKLRLFLALVSSAQSADQLEPLPNIDFNILPGNSLVGLLRVDDVEFDKHSVQGSLAFNQSYREVLDEKNRLIRDYRNTATFHRNLQTMRDTINEKKAAAKETLDALLLEEFVRLGVRFEQATWDETNGTGGKPQKRALSLSDMQTLHPLHWGYEFDEVLNSRGGFDAIIANPPWETFKPNAKEFFMEHSELVTKNKMTIKEFEEKQDELLQDPVIHAAWLKYLSQFPYVSAYYRSAKQYENQISVVNGKKAGTDINLYKLFVEQCYNLLRPGGQCGIIIPSGIYTDLGTMKMRETLFSKCKVRTLFGFSNEKFIFENVHHSVRFAIIVFEKGSSTAEIEAAFRINPREAISNERLRDFLRASEQHIRIPVGLIRRLSPGSLSIMEFKSAMDVHIAEKTLRFPLLGEKIAGTWNLILTNEFHMTNDSKLFHSSPGPNRLPLFTGKMFNQFTLTSEHSGYWIDEEQGRAALSGKGADSGQALDYQGYRWVHRRIARNTDSRTMISTLTPRNVFTEVNSTTIKVQTTGISDAEMLVLCAFANSLVLDWILRQKVSSTLNMFYVYQLPMPRLTVKDAAFQPIVGRTARLICTTPEYDDLAHEIGLNGHSDGAMDLFERAQLRAELDGLIAHLYGLTEAEFVHILATFPLVAEPVKVAAQNAYRDVARGLIK